MKDKFKKGDVVKLGDIGIETAVVQATKGGGVAVLPPLGGYRTWNEDDLRLVRRSKTDCPTCGLPLKKGTRSVRFSCGTSPTYLLELNIEATWCSKPTCGQSIKMLSDEHHPWKCE